MTSSTHTPGPWRQSTHSESDKADCVKAADGKIVARCQALFGRGAPPSDEWEPNARLIAAAPDLLEAAIAAEIACDSVATADERAHARRLIRAAIAKAEGR